MLIGELAKVLEVTPKTLRHYERIGLVPRAERARNGYRNYSFEACRRARLIVGLRSLGLTLDTIQALLAEDGCPLRQKLLGDLRNARWIGNVQLHRVHPRIVSHRFGQVRLTSPGDDDLVAALV